MHPIHHQTMKTVGERLRKLRGDKTQESMGRICDGATRQSWNQWESDLHQIPVHMAKHLVKALGLSLDWLYLGKGNPPT